ncbi:MAG: hydantoinase/carbamoylase family amidase [Rhodobacteraceae bacterium]|nr:hydantoinase/carbamoylase family amidase [Paracoccaceae bacterium]
MTAFAAALLDELRAASLDPPGVTRDSYGPGEQRAHDILRRVGRDLGVEERVDAAGNLYMTRPGRDRGLPAIVIGSHLDSVPHGGNFDGAAGVVAGVAAMAELARRGVMPARDLVVMATRAEEAVWFPLSYPGAEAALGRLSAAALAVRRADTGRTLAAHMRALGFDPEAVARGEVQTDPLQIACFVELHIEQGPRLVARGLPLGIVTAMNGGWRYPKAKVLGAYAHSGAEPRFSRADAVLGFADLVQATEAIWDRLEAEGQELTITFGRVESDPAQHGGSRVLGEVGFSLDVRCEHPGVLARVEAEVQAAMAAIAARRRVRFNPGARFDWAPARMDAGLRARLAAAADRLGIAAGPVSSGAGHDTAVFAAAGVPAAMVFVRNENGSHNPDEALDMGDLGLGVAVLVAFVLGFAAAN